MGAEVEMEMEMGAVMRAGARIEARMRAGLSGLTPAERQVATHILSHYPMSGLGSIGALARAADVSSPTVLRLVQKLGFKGWTDYQNALREEVERLLVAPLSGEAASPVVPHPLQAAGVKLAANLDATLGLIPPEVFDAVVSGLADPARRVFVMGGRLTQGLADYMTTMLQVARPDVVRLRDSAGDWPQAFLDLRAGDLVVIFDIRRYETAAVQAAELAALAQGEVVVITDRWLSPAAVHAQYVLPCHIEVAGAWDSLAVVMMLVEALLAQVQGRIPDQVRARLDRLEDNFSKTRVFRAPKLGALR